MALERQNQKPLFLIKIVALFLVVLCCFGAPKQTLASDFSLMEIIAKSINGIALPANNFAQNFVFESGVLGLHFNQSSQAGQASLFSFFDGVKNNLRDTVRGWLGIAPAVDSKSAAQNQETQNSGAGDKNGLTPALAGDRPFLPPATSSIVTQIINPAKETQTIRTNTVTNNTNTVIVDQDTKNKVSQLLRQLNSDRINYSAGQVYNPPANVGGNSLSIGSSSFTVNGDGNVTAQNIVVKNDLTVQGNFAVAGAQTYSGAADFSASTTAAALSAIQNGSGLALRADDITIKGSTIATNATDTAILINPNGAGAVQFHSASNYIDSNGNLVLDGDVTLTGGGAFFTTANGNLVFAPNGAGNLIVGQTGNPTSVIPFENSAIGNDLGAAAARWYDIYAADKLDVASTTLEANQLSFVDTGRITTGAGKDLTLQPGAGGKTRITDGTTTVDIADGTQALYAVNGARAVRLADGTYAVDAAGDIRLSGDIIVAGGKLTFGTSTEQIDNETANLLKLTTGGNAKIVLGDAAGINQFQVADSLGDVVASIDSLGNATTSGNLAVGGNIAVAGGYIQTGTGANSFTGTSVFSNPTYSALFTGGNVGVGTATPLSKLELDSGQLSLPAGVAGAPSLSFTGDLDSGLWSSGADTLNFSAGGAEMVRILSSGNVGIGTTAPGARLEIDGSEDATQLIVKANSTQSNANPLIRLQNSAGTDLAWLSSDNQSNIFLGFEAGKSNTVTSGSSGLYNTFIGSGAGRLNTTGYANAAIGFQALTANTTGVANIANGSSALYSNTTGNYNTAAGYQSLYSNISGSNNTANGMYSLYSNTTGAYNVANGYQALYSNTTGAYNVANGMGSLFSNTSGNQNVANGNYALLHNTTGVNNVANGGYSLAFNTTGSRNTGLGYYADFLNPTGAGSLALSSGSANLGVGAYRYKITYVLTINGASYETAPSTYGSVTTTAGNQEVTITAIPTYSGPYTCTARKIYRTIVGGTTSYKLAGTISDNLTTFYIDSKADGSLGAEAPSPSNAIMLGAETKAIKASQFAVGSDNAPITEMWLGRGVYSATQNNVQLSASGRNGSNLAGSDLILAGGFGTGTGLGGNLVFKTTPASANSGTLANSLAEAMRITGEGNVGIGTIAPVSELDVSSAIGGILTISRNDTTVTAGDSLGAMQFWSTDAQTTSNKIAASISAIAKSTIATNINPGILAFSTTPSDVAGALTERMRITETGNVGIGTTGPLGKLDITTSQNDTSTGAFTSPSVRLGLTATTNTTGFTGIAYSLSTLTNYGWTSGALRTGSDASVGAFIWQFHNNSAIGTELMRLTSTGNVGIGTTAPASLLNIKGGHFTLGPLSAAATGEWRMQELAANGTDYVGFKAPITIAASKIWTLPATDGTNGQTMITNGAGVLSWAANAATGMANPMTAMGDIVYSATTTTPGTPARLAIGTAGQCLVVTDGLPAWGSCAGSAAVAGTNGQIQFNNSGSFGANSSLTWDNSAKTFAISADTIGAQASLVLRNTNSGDASTNELQIGNDMATSTLAIWVNSSAFAGANNAASIFNRLDSSLIFGTNNLERLRIGNTGNVGIGTATPNYLLDVAGTFRASATSSFSGNVGIGTTSPTSLLHLAAGTDAIGTAPLKFTAGINLAAPEGGAMEYDGADLFFTDGGLTRRTLATLDGTQTFTNKTLASPIIQGVANLTSSYIASAVDNSTGFQIRKNNGVDSVFNIDTANGFVGIGTTAPAGRLHIIGNDDLGSSFAARIGGATTTGLTVLNSGNVGIGTNTPSSILHLSGVPGDLSGGLAFGDGDTGLYESADDNFRLQTAGNDRLTITSAGNVGIGTTAPMAKLHIIDNSGGSESLFKVQVSDNATGYWSVSNATSIANLFIPMFSIKSDVTAYNPASNVTNGAFLVYANPDTAAASGYGAMHFDSRKYDGSGALENKNLFSWASYNNIKMVMAANGNVGIGTTAPQYKLDVNGAINASSLLVNGVPVGSAGGGSQWIGGSDGAISYSGGNVGIGTTSPGAQFQSYVDSNSYVALISAKNASAGDAAGAEMGANNDVSAIVMGILGSGNTATRTYGLGGDTYIRSGGSAGSMNIIVPNPNSSAKMKFFVGTPANGIASMVLDNSYNVGIGTATPQYKLDVAGIINAEGFLKNGVAIGESSSPWLAGDNGAISYTGGSVGVGTTAPAYSLDARAVSTIGAAAFTGSGLDDATFGGSFTGAAAVTYTVVIDGVGTPDTFKWKVGSGAYTEAVAITGSAQTLSDGVTVSFTSITGHTLGDQWTSAVTVANPFAIQTSAGVRIFHAGNNGNVGIGTVAPASKLELGSGQFALPRGTAALPVLTFAGDLNTGVWSAAADTLNFSVAGSEKIRIASTGYVGIGTNNPLVNLHLKGVGHTAMIAEAPANYNAYYAGSIGGTVYSYVGTVGVPNAFAAGSIIGDLGIRSDNRNILFSTDAGTTTQLYLENGGNVGIGTTNPAYQLEVISSGVNIARFAGTNSAGCTFSDGGVIACSSDQRLKKDVEGLNYGINEVMNLRPVAFNWNNDNATTTKSYGFIAQEVETILPKLVMTDDNGFKELNTIGLVPVLAKAIQDQQKQIDALNLVLNPEGVFSDASSTLAMADGGGLFAWLANGLNSLGLALKNGAASLKEVTAGKVRMDKMEMVDQDTGEIYCTWIASGQWVKAKGECGADDLSNQAAQSASQTNQEAANGEGAINQESVVDGAAAIEENDNGATGDGGGIGEDEQGGIKEVPELDQPVAGDAVENGLETGVGGGENEKAENKADGQAAEDSDLSNQIPPQE